jgi:hypothetical protein
MRVVINPGSGPIDGGTAELAEENMRHLIADVEAGEAEAALRHLEEGGYPLGQWKFVPVEPEDYGDGRFAFLIWRGNKCHLIQMPGLSLEKVRYVGEHQNIWDYPRLYVDDGSWVWRFAINIIVKGTGEEEAEPSTEARS